MDRIASRSLIEVEALFELLDAQHPTAARADFLEGLEQALGVPWRAEQMGGLLQSGELVDAHQGNVGTGPPLDDQGLAALGDLVAVGL